MIQPLAITTQKDNQKLFTECINWFAVPKAQIRSRENFQHTLSFTAKSKTFNVWFTHSLMNVWQTDYIR